MPHKPLINGWPRLCGPYSVGRAQFRSNVTSDNSSQISVTDAAKTVPFRFRSRLAKIQMHTEDSGILTGPESYFHEMLNDVKSHRSSAKPQICEMGVSL